MKILHINNFQYSDYMNDAIFHGGRTLFGSDYVDCNPANYMYDDYPNKQDLYGKGFTLYAKLPNINVDRENILEKIQSNFYDLIVYGSICRNKQYLTDVVKHYPKDKIILIDGEDSDFVFWEYTKFGIYFKRELSFNTIPKQLHPISFAAPKELFVKNTNKELQIAKLIPGDKSTYIYKDEDSYYKDYQRSYFANTWKKAGWDCMRHYEIIMNYCFPLFVRLDSCPKNTLTFLPKEKIIDYTNKTKPINSENEKEHFEIMDEVFDHVKSKCTTEAMFNYVLSIL